MGAYVSHICGNKYTSAQLQLLLENMYQNRAYPQSEVSDPCITSMEFKYGQSTTDGIVTIIFYLSKLAREQQEPNRRVKVMRFYVEGEIKEPGSQSILLLVAEVSHHLNEQLFNFPPSNVCRLQTCLRVIYFKVGFYLHRWDPNGNGRILPIIWIKLELRRIS